MGSSQHDTGNSSGGSDTAIQERQFLDSATWRKRKGGYTRRIARRILIAIYQLAGSPVLSNTSCSGALMNAGASSAAASIPLPP